MEVQPYIKQEIKGMGVGWYGYVGSMGEEELPQKKFRWNRPGRWKRGTQVIEDVETENITENLWEHTEEWKLRMR
jgi:hypothetical protein